ncbi:GNAT family N-acetyltransferase [Propionibacteriaceae bacterium Y1923]
MSDYSLTRIDSGTRTPELEAWVRAVSLGFLSGDTSPEQLDKQVEFLARDAGRVRAVTYAADGDSAQVPAAMTAPLATFLSWDNFINTGGGHLEPANFITDVTVRQTARRKGLLREMMMTDLGEARERGQSLAALTVTEATIYGRFGFGVSMLHHRYELDISHGFALRTQPVGNIVQLDPTSDEAAALWRDTFDAFHRSHLGSHGASAAHESSVLGRFDWESGAVDRKMRAVAHVGAGGRVDGFLTYRIVEDEELQVVELLALNPNAELGLWLFIGNHDLLKRATFRRGDPNGPLRWALVDPRRLRTVEVRDSMWTRLLDVPAALRVRRFEQDGEITLGVADPSGLAGGTVTLSVRGGHVEASPSRETPQVTMGIDTLGSLYLGGFSARVLHGAGRIEGSPEAVAAFDDLFRVAEAPRTLRYF